MPPVAAAKSSLERLGRYDGRAPRYTSYPTALAFTPAVGPDQYRDWLAELPLDEPVSVYVHVPFCARLCWYCGCNTRVVRNHGTISSYTGFLQKELALLEAVLPGRLTVGAVHLGGGTPNMLSPDDLAALFAALGRVFALDPAVEVAAELDPLTLNRSWIEAAVRQGLTRASLGVQDLSPAVQAAVNRREPFEIVRQAASWLREAGLRSLNLDLMYGLPRQTAADVIATLDQVLALRPERVAMFGYAHVPWAKPHQKLIRETELPGAVERQDQAEAAAERLTTAGYVRIGLDHFALPGDDLALAAANGALHRNFQGYTADRHATLIGVGASAIGRLPGGFAQNEAGELAWRDMLSRNVLPIARGVAVDADDRFRGDIIERLMCDLAVDLSAARLRHDRSETELAAEMAALQAFAADGLVRLEAERLTVTEEGRPLLRALAAVFDNRSHPADRHSRIL